MTEDSATQILERQVAGLGRVVLWRVPSGHELTVEGTAVWCSWVPTDVAARKAPARPRPAPRPAAPASRLVRASLPSGAPVWLRADHVLSVEKLTSDSELRHGERCVVSLTSGACLKLGDVPDGLAASIQEALG